MSNQTVSVVIPSYNHHRYVIQAIESVLTQTWPQVDLIVIDDGSSDGSADLIQKFWDERGPSLICAVRIAGSSRL